MAIYIILLLFIDVFLFAVNGKWKQSTISVNFNTLGFRVKAAGDLTAQELDKVLDSLTQRSALQVVNRLKQLKNTSSTFLKYSYSSIQDCLKITNENHLKSEGLKDVIRTYFEADIPEISCDAVQLTTVCISIYNTILFGNLY